MNLFKESNMIKLKKSLAALTLLTMLQWTFGIPVSLIVSQLGMGTAYAAASDGLCNAGDATITTPASGAYLKGVALGVAT